MNKPQKHVQQRQSGKEWGIRDLMSFRWNIKLFYIFCMLLLDSGFCSNSKRIHKAKMREWRLGAKIGEVHQGSEERERYGHYIHPAGLTCLPLALLSIWRTAWTPTATAAALCPLRRARSVIVVAFWRHWKGKRIERSNHSLRPLPGPASNSQPLRWTP